MFKRIKLRLRDMRTIAKLVSGADEQAHAMGDEKPGAEHFLLSALNLTESSAKRAFTRVGADADKFHDAIKNQYKTALTNIGVSAEIQDSAPKPIESTKVFHNSQPSGESVMKRLYHLKKNDKD